MSVSHVEVYQEENRLNSLLYEYHREKVMQQHELFEVFHA